ncbi:uncharacterized protein K460DRAFT_364487 [Cucurbitaria berberidis CBS 394.84]|uniref:Uncharacterized protein n=1 Tax=Cucurbitaria berberidis CBS 394.84 TaxID=1168544 RepID=A0A9P4LBU1_9PLEO|nr:uncharacterized protein K460DRAFT_364487 [Cucurbitaria berberidis CBS 394.84]KAF1848494.1 hypothetical protein K460DRAFT_364487 [Cucurbitaria berberidis CBS 394.84]
MNIYFTVHLKTKCVVLRKLFTLIVEAEPKPSQFQGRFTSLAVARIVQYESHMAQCKNTSIGRPDGS